MMVMMMINRQWRRQDLLRGGADMEINVMGHSQRTPGPSAAAAR